MSDDGGPGRRLPSLGPRGEGWFALQLLLLAAIGAAGAFLGGNWSGAPRFATALTGAVLLLASIALAFRAIRELDGSLSPLPRPVDGAVLVRDGVYRRLRHPIYLALMLSAVGWGLLTASFLALGLALVLIVLLDLKARREEVWLRERFSEYEAYAARTPRFVPRIY